MKNMKQNYYIKGEWTKQVVKSQTVKLEKIRSNYMLSTLQI